MANGAAVDARKESKVLQELVFAEKKGKERRKRDGEGANKKASSIKKRKKSGWIDINEKE